MIVAAMWEVLEVMVGALNRIVCAFAEQWKKKFE